MNVVESGNSFDYFSLHVYPYFSVKFTEVDTTLVPVVPSSLVYVQSTSRVPLLIFLILSTFTEPGVVPSKVVVQRVLPSEPFSVTVPPM